MVFDKKSLDRLLSLNDSQLQMVIKKIASDNGVNTSNFNLSSSDLKGIRSALSMATDADLERASQILKNYKSGKGGT